MLYLSAKLISGLALRVSNAAQTYILDKRSVLFDTIVFTTSFVLQ
jgi:hypothetical protein